MRRVVNQRSVGSLDVDSVAGSGAPPPGYTSQRDTASSIGAIDDDEEDVIFKDSQPPPSMEPPCKDPSRTLPSPYSIENLRSHGQDQNPRLSLHQSSSCTHAYARTHSQCTPVHPSSYYPPQPQLQQQLLLQQQQQRTLVTPYISIAPLKSSLPTTYLVLLLMNNPVLLHIIIDVQQMSIGSCLYKPITNIININKRHHPTPIIVLPNSPYRHHPQNTYPPPLRILTYPSTDEDHYVCKEHGNEEEEGNQSSLLSDQNMRMMMMNSTATILSHPEEPLGYQSNHDLAHGRRHRLPSLSNTPTRRAATSDVIAMNSATKQKNPTAGSSAPSPLPQTQSQPTNYVHISRKCNPPMPTSKSRGRRRKTVQPKGTFPINPELYIPPSLLNAMEDPVFFRFKPSSDTEDTGETRKRKGSRKTNLRLEVENGGIDVDIHLVPTTISTDVGEDATCAGNRGQQDVFCDTPASSSKCKYFHNRLQWSTIFINSSSSINNFSTYAGASSTIIIWCHSFS